MPANHEPTITCEAPAARASATSRGWRTPPSAQTCLPEPARLRGALEHRGELRAADGGHHPRRAHGTRADADLDDVRAGRDEVARALGGDDVARDDRHLRVERADRAERVEHLALVAVRGVDDEHVDAGLEQLEGLLLDVAVDADRRGDAQAAVRVDAGW